MNSQISFVDGEFSLIHIPLLYYPYLLQPILRILLPPDTPFPSDEASSSPDGSAFSSLCLNSPDHGFLNISITPLEASIVCSTSLAQSHFQPAISRLPDEIRDQVSILPDPFLVFSVTSSGMEAGQRVMDLTSPLAMAGISIFFITTYYTDFILVPSKDQKTVIQALLERGFELDDIDGSGRERSFSTGNGRSKRRGSSEEVSPLGSPGIGNVAELQRRTVRALRARDVRPRIEEGLELVQCSGHSQPSERQHSYSSYGRPGSHRSSNSGSTAWQSSLDAPLYLALIAVLSTTPRFFSLTLSEDAPSLLLDKSVLPIFGSSVVGNKDALLIPIFLDLGQLPTESTGIVCGVAGMVVAEAKRTGEESGELSYLSTARAGTLVIRVEGQEMAMKAMEELTEDRSP